MAEDREPMSETEFRLIEANLGDVMEALEVDQAMLWARELMAEVRRCRGWEESDAGDV